MKLISIICPVFNEEECIPLFYQRLINTLSAFNGQYLFEIIFTDNNSTDSSYSILKNLASIDKAISILSLSRNFGYQKSLLAGLTYSKGDAVVFIDVDCEDPPEMIGSFIEFWEQGFDIVYGLRKGRPELKVVTLFRNIFYKVLKNIGDTPINLNMAEFSLLSRSVCNQILINRTTYPFIRNEIAYVGLRQKAIPYDRQNRVAGVTHYNFPRMFSFAIAGIFTSSTLPLRLSLYILPAAVLSNILVIILDITGIFYESIKYLIVADLMYLITFIAFISIYVARIYHDVIGRPNFVIDNKKSIYSKSGDL